jgi:hypothetical protein
VFYFAFYIEPHPHETYCVFQTLSTPTYFLDHSLLSIRSPFDKPDTTIMSIQMIAPRNFATVLILQVTVWLACTRAADSVPTVDGTDLHLPATAFGGAIEAAAVNAQGDVFAADFSASGASASTAFGVFNQVEGGMAKVLDLKVNPRFTASQDGVAKPPLLAGARFLPGDRLLLAGSYVTLESCTMLN